LGVKGWKEGALVKRGLGFPLKGLGFNQPLIFGKKEGPRLWELGRPIKFYPFLKNYPPFFGEIYYIPFPLLLFQEDYSPSLLALRNVGNPIKGNLFRIFFPKEVFKVLWGGVLILILGVLLGFTRGLKGVLKPFQKRPG